MQISMFDEYLEFPRSFDDIQNLWERYIFEGETDSDVFTKNPVKEGYSYSFYGVKAFEFDILENNKVKLKLPDDIICELFPEKKNLKEGQFYAVSGLTSDEMLRLVELLKT